MKKYLLLLPFLTSVLQGIDLPKPALPMSGSFEYGLQAESKEVVINNRILFKFNGKVVTVMDVVKKMDLLFHQRFPELAAQPIARYQFYLYNWENILRNCIDDQVILADAQEKKVEVTDGDIREEMEKTLGPDVVMSIEKMGLKFEEVWEMLKTELLVKKMTNMMVKAKAVREVTPVLVRQAYEQFAANNPAKDMWHYQVLSIRSDLEEKNKSVSASVEKLLKEQVPFEKLPSALAEETALDTSIQVKLSEVYNREEKDLSLAHKAILQTINIGEGHTPYLQKTQSGKEVVTQFFYLIKKEKEESLPLAKMEQKLQNELIQQEVAKSSTEYLDKLYRHFGFKEDYLTQMMPEDFVPFTLR